MDFIQEFHGLGHSKQSTLKGVQCFSLKFLQKRYEIPLWEFKKNIKEQKSSKDLFRQGIILTWVFFYVFFYTNAPLLSKLGPNTER